MNQIVSKSKLVLLRCWCGLEHAVPASLRAEQMRQHNDGWNEVMSVYCPIGHAHSPAGESKCKRLERQIATAKACEDQLRAELRETEGRRRAEKVAKTKLKKRIASGVCPCCNRTFQNLARHMKGQHPEFQDNSQS